MFAIYFSRTVSYIFKSVECNYQYMKPLVDLVGYSPSPYNLKEYKRLNLLIYKSTKIH